MAEKKTFEVEIRDGKAFVDGVDTKLTVEDYQTMRVRASGLRAQRFVNRYNGVAVDDPRILGRGTIDGSLKVYGLGATTRTLGLSIGVAPEADAERLNWHASWGYIAADWETGTGTSWYLEIRLPRSTWDAFQRDYEAGRVGEVSVSVKGNLWTEWSPMPALDETVYHLLPDRYGSSSGGHGTVESFGWGDQPLRRLDENEGDDPPDTGSKLAADAPAGENPLALLVRSGAEANVQIAKLLRWGVPAVVILLTIIALRV